MDIYFRKPEPADLAALYEQKNDPEIKSLLGGFANPASRRDLEEWLESHRKRSDEVIWAIVCQGEERCLGHVGLYQIEPIARSADFGIMVGDKDAWGQGVGKSATIHALRYGFEQLNLNRIGLTVLATNLRAVALYRKLGFIEEGTLRQAQFRDGAYRDVMVMGMLRGELIDG